MKNGNVWAVVCMVLGGLAAIVVLAVTESTASDLMVYIGSAVVPTVTILLVGERHSSQIAEVRKEVNGRFSEAIAKIPNPEDRPQV